MYFFLLYFSSLVYRYCNIDTNLIYGSGALSNKLPFSLLPRPMERRSIYVYRYTKQGVICDSAEYFVFEIFDLIISWTFYNGLTNTSLKIKCASFFPRFLIMASSHKRSFWSVSHYWGIFLKHLLYNKWWKISYTYIMEYYGYY